MKFENQKAQALWANCERALQCVKERKIGGIALSRTDLYEVLNHRFDFDPEVQKVVEFAQSLVILVCLISISENTNYSGDKKEKKVQGDIAREHKDFIYTYITETGEIDLYKMDKEWAKDKQERYGSSEILMEDDRQFRDLSPASE